MSWWYRRGTASLSREMRVALIVSFIVGLAFGVAGRGRWAPVFNNLWLVGMCMLGTYCLVVGMLLMRGLVSSGPWSGRSGGASVCWGIGLLLNFAPKLIVPPELQAGGLELAMRLSYWASCILLAVGLFLLVRSRGYAQRRQEPESRA